MDLVEGETVTVLATRDDGWCVGASADGRRVGLFPGNYILDHEEEEGKHLRDASIAPDEEGSGSGKLLAT